MLEATGFVGGLVFPISHGAAVAVTVVVVLADAASMLLDEPISQGANEVILLFTVFIFFDGAILVDGMEFEISQGANFDGSFVVLPSIAVLLVVTGISGALKKSMALFKPSASAGIVFDGNVGTFHGSFGCVVIEFSVGYKVDS